MDEQPLTICPFDLAPFDLAWVEQCEQTMRAIMTMFNIAELKAGYAASTEAIWVFSPRTYESIKFAHAFPALPARKLRKCQERRIARRKQQYRKHRARVNAAIQERIVNGTDQNFV